MRLRFTTRASSLCSSEPVHTASVYCIQASAPRSEFGEVATHCTQLKISPAGQPKAQLFAACGNPCYHLLGGCPHLSAPRDKPFSTPFNPRAIWRAAERNTPQPCCGIACTLAVPRAAPAPPRTASSRTPGEQVSNRLLTVLSFPSVEGRKALSALRRTKVRKPCFRQLAA